MAATPLPTVDFLVGPSLGSYQEYLPKRLIYSIIETADLKLSHISWGLEELWHGSNL